MILGKLSAGYKPIKSQISSHRAQRRRKLAKSQKVDLELMHHQAYGVP